MAINNFIGEYQIKDTSVCDKLITYFKNNISRASKGGFMINGELEVDELFWQSNQPGDNIPWRKVSQTQGKNLKAQSTHNFKPNTVVWQKT